MAKQPVRFERVIDHIEEVPNGWDNWGRAFKVTLSCGHHCVLTGSAVVNRRTVECEPCAQGRLA
jgi:hypothetical protein